ncbi:hypothetical protein H6G45_08760 [Synechocystis sp. FACHB-383]|uniref:hypothetical protein n=1 Tax=Synechocystis sp. FACHB-383 TaxID=2692864 RepID=UPI001682DA71|nr:hypothetical protein [Synechocystis sp. FACHB-383]MBD2653579.1 hypothetical protein [Synechocystis sp. FACHB-383]
MYTHYIGCFQRHNSLQGSGQAVYPIRIGVIGVIGKYLKQGLADNITFFCNGRLQVFIRDGNNLKSVGLEHQNFAW